MERVKTPRMQVLHMSSQPSNAEDHTETSRKNERVLERIEEGSSPMSVQSVWHPTAYRYWRPDSIKTQPRIVSPSWITNSGIYEGAPPKTGNAQPYRPQEWQKVPSSADMLSSLPQRILQETQQGHSNAGTSANIKNAKTVQSRSSKQGGQDAQILRNAENTPYIRANQSARKVGNGTNLKGNPAFPDIQKTQDSRTIPHERVTNASSPSMNAIILRPIPKVSADGKPNRPSNGRHSDIRNTRNDDATDQGGGLCFVNSSES
ncbi:hypothetical protein AB6A40_004205 [Gnathostoma spinigerum]|uniref:Uncharacterized protein n=1 Tax=Gnathostoma spinigerum TaxID=75299 RepID=A0ABD6ECV5_9BILA